MQRSDWSEGRLGLDLVEVVGVRFVVETNGGLDLTSAGGIQ